MKHVIGILVVVIAFTPYAVFADNPEPSDGKPDFGDFDKFVARVLKEWRVPGVAVAVIHEDKTLLAKGYGYRDLEERLPVTAKTLFSIASISKTFTATAAAILVDDGKLHWNDRVREHLRTFRLYNEDAAAQLTIRDCLSHQTGLPRAGLRWYGINGWPEEHMTPEIAYRTLRHVEPSAPARSHYYYSNSGYLTMGQMIVKYGDSWESFLQDRILDPLRMDRTNFSVAKSQADPDHAKPYVLFEGDVIRRPFFPGEVIGPAGGINSNIEELARFLRLYLGQGELDGRRIVSKGRMKEVLTPEVVMPEFNSYGSANGFHSMGWQVIMIQGEKWGRHTGGLPGFTAVASFCPKRECAYVVLTNLANRPVAELIENNIRSRLLGRVPTDQFELFRNMEAKDQADFEKLRSERRPPRIKDTAPGRPLGDYAGTFSNPAYGDFVVILHDGSLRWRHHGFYGSLKHYHYDVFDMEVDREMPGMLDGELFHELVTFHEHVSGTIDSLSFSRSMPTDTRFTRVK